MTTPVNFTPVAVDPQQLGASLGDLYTAGASGAFVHYIGLVNDDVTAVTATLHYVPSGGSAGDDNIIAKAIVVPSNGLMINALAALGGTPLAMEAGGKLRGLASAASQVTVHIGITDLA